MYCAMYKMILATHECNVVTGILLPLITLTVNVVIIAIKIHFRGIAPLWGA